MAVPSRRGGPCPAFDTTTRRPRIDTNTQVAAPQATGPLATFSGRVRLRFPRDPAELFGVLASILALGDQGAALEGLLADVDFSSASLTDIYYLVHRRPPELTALADGAGTPLAQHLQSALESDEFQERAIEHILAAFPALPRRFLLQVSGATADLTPAGSIWLDPALAVPGRTAKPALLRALARIAQLVPHVTGFCVPVPPSGHDRPRDMALRDLAPRRGDRLMMITEDPVEIMVRAANRAVETLADPLADRAATEIIRRQLGLDERPAGVSPETPRDLAIRALLDPVLCPPNPLCRALVGEPGADYLAAIHRIASHDIELVDATTMAAWAATVGAPFADDHRPPPANPILATVDAIGVVGDRLRAAAEQDRILHEVVLWGLARHQAPAVRGSDLVGYAGRRLLDGLPRQLLRRHGPPLPDPVVASGPQPARDYMAAHRPAVATQTMLFGIGGNAGACLAQGWSGAEDGYVWTNGFRAALRLPRPASAADHVLRLHADPYVAGEGLAFQQIDIVVNGTPVAAARLVDHAVLEIMLPWTLLAGADAVTVDFDLPDATRPADIGRGGDTRQLALCLREAALLPILPMVKPVPTPAAAAIVVPRDDELMLRFESIGENCEFGLVQRRCGAEPLGLLRFSSAPLPKLLAALNQRFEGIGRPDMIEVQVSDNGQEYMVLDRRFGLLSHAWVLTREKTAEEVHQRECRRLPFLARKLVEDLIDGEKLFVFHGMTPLDVRDARTLAAAVAGYGPSTVLWVEKSDADHAPGSVEWIDGHLLKGYVDRFAPGENAHDLSLACWVVLCRNAYRAWRRSNEDAVFTQS